MRRRWRSPSGTERSFEELPRVRGAYTIGTSASSSFAAAAFTTISDANSIPVAARPSFGSAERRTRRRPQWASEMRVPKTRLRTPVRIGFPIQR